MAFKFTDLSVTLTTRVVNGEPQARLIVMTCQGPSLELLFGTCGTDTQAVCTTHPQDLKLLASQGNPSGLEELQTQLEAMLRSFDPA